MADTLLTVPDEQLTLNLFPVETVEVATTDLIPGDFMPNWIPVAGRTVVEVRGEGRYRFLDYTVVSDQVYTQVVRFDAMHTVVREARS